MIYQIIKHNLQHEPHRLKLISSFAKWVAIGFVFYALTKTHIGQNAIVIVVLYLVIRKLVNLRLNEIFLTEFAKHFDQLLKKQVQK